MCIYVCVCVCGMYDVCMHIPTYLAYLMLVEGRDFLAQEAYLRPILPSQGARAPGCIQPGALTQNLAVQYDTANDDYFPFPFFFFSSSSSDVLRNPPPVAATD